MPTVFAPLLGRTGNLLFIYAHAQAWCEQNGYTLSTHPWYGEKVFNIPEAIRPETHAPDITWPERMYQHQNDLIYTRKQVREWFSFKPEILDKLRVITPAELLFDVRTGQDMIDAGMVCLGKQCYVDAARKFGYGVLSAEWELYPESPTRLPQFFGEAGGCGLGTNWGSLPAFYRMMTARVHFRANSSFSYWAGVLGNAKVYAPVLTGMTGGIPDQYCSRWVEGNWPCMTQSPDNSDLHLCEQTIP